MCAFFVRCGPLLQLQAQQRVSTHFIRVRKNKDSVGKIGSETVLSEIILQSDIGKSNSQQRFAFAKPWDMQVTVICISAGKMMILPNKNQSRGFTLRVSHKCFLL